MLTELVNALEERKALLEKDVATIHERQAMLRSELELLDKVAGEKEPQLAAITPQSIKEYKTVWKSYTPPNPFPCPFCFAFSKRLSPLEPQSRVDDVEPLKCNVCQEVFEIPVELLYA